MSRRMLRTVVGTAVAMALLVTAAPAHATEPGVTRSAIAFWTLGDALQTRVSLQVSNSMTEPSGGPPERRASVFLFVTQQFCDSTTDERVFRSFFASGPVDHWRVRVRPDLGAASMDAAVPVLSAGEQRVADCEATGGTPVFRPLPRPQAVLDVAWTATGPVRDVQPGIIARSAEATGSLSAAPLAELPSLGTSATAEIRERRQ